MQGNRKGPENRGAKSGRALGYCDGYKSPGYEKQDFPMRGRRGRGRGLNDILDRLEKIEARLEKMDK